MSLIYPNTVPANNLRVPDALTIEHGPAELLGRFVIAGDRVARGVGLGLRLRHDFDRLSQLNDEQSKIGNWYPLMDMFNPERTDVSPQNAFWIAGEDETGDIVATYAARIYYWPDTNLAEQAVAMAYGRDDGQRCVVTAPAAKEMTGLIMSVGGAWVRPDFRGRELSQLLPRMAKAYALSRWPLNWVLGYCTPTTVEKGVAAGYGSKHFSYSVLYPDMHFGELVLAYTAGHEVYEDLDDYLITELSSSSSSKFAPRSFSTNLAQDVTKTSFEGVFQGSNSRS